MAGILLEGNAVTDEERAAHARALAAEKRIASRRRATSLKARVGGPKLAKALPDSAKITCKGPKPHELAGWCA